MSDITRLQGCKQLAVHLHIVWQCGIVVSPHIIFFLVDPLGLGGGVQNSTVVPMESLLYVLLHTAADDDSSAAICLLPL